MFRRIAKSGKGTAWFVVVMLMAPFVAGCGGGGRSSVPPPVDDSGYGRGSSRVDTGFGRTQGAPVAQPRLSKTVILAGAAALYYLYKKQQNATGQGPDGQYYLSKNGRVYYRDAEHRAHWVTPPPQGIQVSENEARGLEGFQGYNRSSSGRDLSNLPEGRF
jgi:hypothetical protein